MQKRVYIIVLNCILLTLPFDVTSGQMDCPSDDITRQLVRGMLVLMDVQVAEGTATNEINELRASLQMVLADCNPVFVDVTDTPVPLPTVQPTSTPMPQVLSRVVRVKRLNAAVFREAGGGQMQIANLNNCDEIVPIEHIIVNERSWSKVEYPGRWANINNPNEPRFDGWVSVDFFPEVILDNYATAIVTVTKNTSVYSFPQTDSDEILKLVDDTAAEILRVEASSEPPMIQIRLSNDGPTGWIPLQVFSDRLIDPIISPDREINMHRNPDQNQEIVRHLTPSDRLLVVDVYDDRKWLKVNWLQVGWIETTDLLLAPDNKIVIPNTSPVNMRSGPDISSTLLAELTPNDQLTLMQDVVEGDWAPVTYGSLTGYVYSCLLKIPST